MMGGLSPLARDAARLLAGLALTLGCHLAIHGHLSAGGGLAGGLVAAAAFVLVVLAFGAAEGSPALTEPGRLFAPLGLILLVMIACRGMDAGYFFRHEDLFGAQPGDRSVLGGGTALMANLALGLTVWMGAMAGFLALAAFRRQDGRGAE